MVSFQDLLNIARPNVVYGQNHDIKNSLIMLWIFVICYSLSTKANIVSPSVGSLIGMYYMVYDILTILKNRIVAALKGDADEVVEEEVEEEVVEEEVVEDDGQETIVEDTEGTEDDDEDDEVSNINDYRQNKALQQLEEYANKIQQMNLQRKAASEEDYSDLPPLISEYNLREPGHYAPSAEEAQI